MPRLRVLAGPSYDEMTTIEPNNNKAYPIRSDLFEGKVIVHIKGFADEQGVVSESDYFQREDRRDITWSIQVQGRFLQPYSADDIMFGNTFDRALKLPWGTSAALKFMRFIDPSLEHDLMSQSFPWALSPIIATMPHFTHTPVSDGALPPQFPDTQSIGDDVTRLRVSRSSPSLSGPASDESDSTSLSSAESEKSQRAKNYGGSTKSKSMNSKQRRNFFSKADKRRAVTFGPGDVITTDFCYNFITFPSLSLCLPGGLSFDLTKYWDGQPVRFVCCERGRDGSTESVRESRVFWCVAIERVD